MERVNALKVRQAALKAEQKELNKRMKAEQKAYGKAVKRCRTLESSTLKQILRERGEDIPEQ